MSEEKRLLLPRCQTTWIPKTYSAISGSNFGLSTNSGAGYCFISLPAPLSPLNLLENTTQALSSGGIDRLEECHPAGQMRTKFRMNLAVLGSGAVAEAIGQGGLETIKIGARDVHALIRHNPSQMLAHTLPHDACLAVIHRKSFLQQDGSHVDREAIHTFREKLMT